MRISCLTTSSRHLNAQKHAPTYLNELGWHLGWVHHVATGICLLGLQLLVRGRRQASLAQREQHLGRLVHRQDYWVFVVACPESLTDLLNVVQALLRTVTR